MQKINLVIIITLLFIAACKKSEPAPDETPPLDPTKDYAHLKFIDETIFINDDGTLFKALGLYGYVYGNEMHDLIDAAQGFYVLRNDGTVWMLQDTATHNSTPIQLTQIDHVTKIEWGGHITSSFLMFLKDDGTVWTMGKNNNGQLGDSTYIDHMEDVVQVYGLTDVVDISAGVLGHALALKSDGTVWGWGSNYRGELGDTNLTMSINNPVQLPGFSNIISISAGNTNTMALRSDGKILVIGENNGGELGDGSMVDHVTHPVFVSGINDAIQISAGNGFGLCLRSDSTVYSWGTNDYGNLGDGTTTLRRTPVKVYYVSHVKFISARSASHIGSAIERDGISWVWGDDILGYLGFGIGNIITRPKRMEEE